MTARFLEQSHRTGARHPDSPMALELAAQLATAEPFPEVCRVSVVGAGLEFWATNVAHPAAGVRRLTRVAAGSALFAARLAVAMARARPFTALVPDPRRPSLVAVLRPGAAAAPTRAERALYHALARPSSPRPGRPVGPALPLLRWAADAEGVWLRTLTDPTERVQVAAACGRGIDPEPTTALLVLGSHFDLPAGDIRAGQAARRVLLTARALGLRGALLAGPVELSGERRSVVPGARAGLVPLIVVEVAAHPLDAAHPLNTDPLDDGRGEAGICPAPRHQRAESDRSP